jgi:hypothetical protein
MSRVKIALAGGLVVTAAAIALTLLQSPAQITRGTQTPGETEIDATTAHGTTICQRHQLLPRDTTEIQPKLGANSGPEVHLRVISAGTVITGGQRGSGWSGRIVTVPVKPLSRNVSDVTICIDFSLHNETVSAYGSPASGTNRATEGGQILKERLWINDLSPAKQSWASQLGSIFTHLELGRTMTGPWIVVLVLALMASVIALASMLALKELR